MTRATNDVENVAEMFSQGLVALVTDLFKMAGFAVALFLVEPTLALAAFSVVPFLVLASVVFRLKVREAFRDDARPPRAHQRVDPGDGDRA